MQAPALHTPALPQLLPQVPQFAASIFVSTHLPPHSVWPAGQTHTPLVQL